MPKNQGFAERLRRLLREHDFWKNPEDRPDIKKFSESCGFIHSLGTAGQPCRRCRIQEEED